MEVAYLSIRDKTNSDYYLETFSVGLLDLTVT